jgi:hypothetical protein
LHIHANYTIEKNFILSIGTIHALPDWTDEAVILAVAGYHQSFRHGAAKIVAISSAPPN